MNEAPHSGAFFLGHGGLVAGSCLEARSLGGALRRGSVITETAYNAP